MAHSRMADKLARDLARDLSRVRDPVLKRKCPDRLNRPRHVGFERAISKNHPERDDAHNGGEARNPYRALRPWRFRLALAALS
jgi:hypothetical protein